MNDKDFSTKATFKRLWPMIWQYRLGILIAIIALVFNALTEAGLIYLLKPLLDKGFGEADLSFLKWLPIIVILLIFTRDYQFCFRLLSFVGVGQCSNGNAQNVI